MAAYTEHYHLHQWEPEDNFLRTDFNEDFRVLDKALALKPEILSGSYTGDHQQRNTGGPRRPDRGQILRGRKPIRNELPLYSLPLTKRAAPNRGRLF